MRLFQQENLDEAREIQEFVARGDWTAIQRSFIAVKRALELFMGMAGNPGNHVLFLERRGWKD
jgi:hypothetical protein